MTGFRILLAAFFAALVVYTCAVIMRHGWNLLAIFFDDIANTAWPGQFDLDFMFLLALCALWVAWRHQFSGMGFALALLAFIGGVLFLSAYLLVVSLQANGDTREMLMGKSRARI